MSDLFYFYSTRTSNEKNYNKVKNSASVDIDVCEFVNNGEKSLTEAYNYAIEKSTSKIVVLAHDDITLGEGWDKKIIELFENSDYGVIGVAGSAKLNESGIWWEDPNTLAGIVEHEGIQNGKKSRWYSRYSDDKDYIMDVVTVDGLFIAIHLDRIKSKFNPLIKGFHFYDISFCLDNFAKGVKIGVTTKIKIRHQSIGALSDSWYMNKETFLAFYKNFLPSTISTLLPLKYSNLPKKTCNQIDNKIAIIIPTKDKMDYVISCIDSIFKLNPQCNMHVYLADTGSSEESKELFAKFMEFNDDYPITVINYDYYNFAKINNDVVKNHLNGEEIVLFCNNDVKLLNNAIELMLEQFMKHKKTVGTVGCQLLYEDGSVQHGGITIYLDKLNQVYVTHKALNSYYGALESVALDTLGSTGAFLMISKKLFVECGMFDERTVECFEDVVLNLDCIMKGKQNMYVGNAICHHYESLSRNEDPRKVEKSMKDYREVLFPKIHKMRKILAKYMVRLM